MFKTILILLAMAASAVVTAAYIQMRPAAPGGSLLVGKTTVHRLVPGPGKIEGLAEVKIRATRPTMVERVFFGEGEEVELGAILADLNSAELDAKIAEGEALLKEKTAVMEIVKTARAPEKIQQARDELKKAQESVKAEMARVDSIKNPDPLPPATETQKATAKTAIEEAQQNLVLAEIELSKLRSGPGIAELDKADNKLQLAKQAVETARSRVDAAKGGVTIPVISPLIGIGDQPKTPTSELKASYEKALKELKVAESEYQIATQGANVFDIGASKARVELCKIKLEAAKAGEQRLLNPEAPPPPPSHEIKQAEAALVQAQLKVRQAESALRDLERPPEKAEIDRADAAKEGAEKALHALKLQKEGLKLRAPFAGLITQRHREPGEIVNVLEPIITMIDFSQKNVRAEFDINRLADLKKGMRVKLNVLKDSLEGKIERIGKVGPRTLFSDDKSEPTGGQVVQVIINITEPKDVKGKEIYNALRPDLRVDAWVTLEKRDDVIAIPKTYRSRLEDGVEYVWILDKSDLKGEQTPRLQPVKCGLYDELNVEITEGLNVGDRITKPRTSH